MNLKILFLLFGSLMLFGGYAFAQEKESMESIWAVTDSIGIDFREKKIKIFDIITPDSINPSVNENQAVASILINNELLYIQLIRKTWQIPSDSVSGSYPIYSIGANIVNKKNEIIVNGDSLIMTSEANSCIFIPINDSLVYLFTVGHKKALRFRFDGFDNNLPNSQLAYYLFPTVYCHKIKCISGIWTVTEKNKRMSQVDMRYELAAVRHHNGKDWWVYAHERNNSNGFVRYRVSENGVEQYPTQYIGRRHYPILGDSNLVKRISISDIFFLESCVRMVISKDGTQLAYISSVKDSLQYLHSDSKKPILDLFKINRCTGELYYWQDMTVHIPRKILNTRGMWISVEFSPSGRYIFFSCVRGMLFDNAIYFKNPEFYRIDVVSGKFDLYSTNINNNARQSFLPCKMLMETGSNCIYINNATLGVKKHLAVIRFPDAEAIDSIGFDSLGIFCEGKYINWGLPNNPHYDLGPVPQLPLQKKPVAYRDTLCPQDTARLGGYFPAERFVHRWSPMTGLSYVEGDSGTVLFHPTAIPQQDTLYTFVMTTSGRPNTCHDGEMTSDTFRVLVYGRNHRPCFVSVPEPEAPSSPKILIYPNPTNGTLYLQSKGIQMLRFMLYSPTGQIAFEQNLSSTEATLHVGNLADGTYLCKIITTEGIFTQKLMIVK